MRETRELEQIVIRLQDNGEGTVGFQHRIRIRRDDGSRVADGDAVAARIRLADFREQAFEVNGKSITGAEFQVLCGLIADEMERQAESRERATKRAEREDAERKAALEAEQQRVAAEHAAAQQRMADEQAALADATKQAEAAAEAEREAVKRQHAGKAERGA